MTAVMKRMLHYSSWWLSIEFFCMFFTLLCDPVSCAPPSKAAATIRISTFWLLKLVLFHRRRNASAHSSHPPTGGHLRGRRDRRVTVSIIEVIFSLQRVSWFHESVKVVIAQCYCTWSVHHNTFLAVFMIVRLSHAPIMVIKPWPIAPEPYKIL